jgi:RimJ/RimL family protein N-acetyltransferase
MTDSHRAEPALSAQPAPLPGRTTLTGRLVSLEPLDATAHAASLYRDTHGDDGAALWRYLGDGPFDDRDIFTDAIGAKARAADRVYFAIVDRHSNDAIGYACYLRIKPAHRTIEVGDVLFTPRLQQTAAATEAMFLMARHAFEDLGYRRYEWKCNALNMPSRRAAERLGFTFEGIFRQHMIVKGENRDTAWFAMIDSEWPRRRQTFEAWLDPANFGPSGKQRRPLRSFAGAVG